MYIYINEKENLYPRFPGDIQLIDPNWTIDAPLPEGWELVVNVPTPDCEVGQTLEELNPEKIDGVWYRKWKIRNLTEEELEAQRLWQEEVTKEINAIQQQA